MCVAYDVDGVRHDEMPMTQTEFAPRQADLRVLPRLVGGHLRLPRRSTTCPPTPRRYVRALEEMSGTRIWGVGVGPGREQTLGRTGLTLLVGREAALVALRLEAMLEPREAIDRLARR